jgi:hypothetical protein
VATRAAGEALLGLSAGAPGVDWTRHGAESATVSVLVDGRGEILAIRQPMSGPDTGAGETVTALNRAFFLGEDYLPRPSFLTWHGSVTLTPAQPQATLSG